MTPQEIFDTVKDHLSGMKYRSYFNGTCRYRGRNGAKCAVGCLIPDAVYNVKMETKVVSQLILDDLGSVLPPFFAQNRQLLTDLQTVHDISKNWEPDVGLNEAGFAALCEVASRNDLN